MRTVVPGAKFGRLTAVAYVRSGGNCSSIWGFECDCGSKKEINLNNIKSGAIKSCGCLNKELSRERLLKHGESRTRLYHTWGLMKKRCYNPNEQNYLYYGAKGITVCDDWLKDFVSFRSWAFSHGYSDGLTIDRIDSNGNYEPGNCQWITKSENSKKAVRRK